MINVSNISAVAVSVTAITLYNTQYVVSVGGGGGGCDGWLLTLYFDLQA